MSLGPRRGPSARVLGGVAGVLQAALWLGLCGTGACRQEAAAARASELEPGNAEAPEEGCSDP